MKKKSILLLAIIILSLNSFCQSVYKKIEEQIYSPERNENAAKADVYINKKIMQDSLLSNSEKNVSVKKNKRKHHKKYKH